MKLTKTVWFLLFSILLFASCSVHEAPELTVPPTPGIDNPKRKIIVTHARKSIGRPYRWGGESPKTGFDCSGLVAYTHEKAGIFTPRRAVDQLNQGRAVLKRDLQAADLVFFEIPGWKKSYHVGVYIGKGLFIHAPGKNRRVTYGKLTNPYFKENYIGSRSYLYQ